MRWKMIEKFKDIRYKFSEQKEKYVKICKSLSHEEKQKLLDSALEKDLWAYFQLIVEALFDISSGEEKYIQSLEKIYMKVKNDLASSPFFEMLIRVGKEKPEIGILIYNRIQKESKNEDLKSVSGLILGGYSINNEEYLDELLGNKGLNYPITNITLKAILVKYENQKQIPKKIYDFLNLVSNSDEEIFLTELMNLCIFLYKIDESYFYSKIIEIMGKKKSRVNGMIFIRSQKLSLSDEQFIELAKLTRDCDEYALGELMYTITNYSENVKEVSELFIYWVNKDLEFKVGNFDWALQELAKKNSNFIIYFLDNFERVKTGKLESKQIFPRIFEKLASQNIEVAMNQLMAKKIYEKDPKLFYELVSKIIGIIYKNNNKKFVFDLFLPLAIKIEEISENTAFINENTDTFNKIIRSKNFNGLIDYIDYLLEQLRFRKTDYNFDEIDKNLSGLEELNTVVKKKIEKLKREKNYSPLFWLGSQQRDKELKEAYLEEIGDFLNLSKQIPNEKSKDNKKSLVDSLGNENRFWDNLSEIIFSNKFLLNKEEYNLIIEPKIPNKASHADLSIELKGKKIFFEIKNSKGDRSLHLDNGAVSIKNKVDGIIKGKSSQFYAEKTFNETKEDKRRDLFFIVIDTSNSVIDEYMIANSFFGSLVYKFYRNKEIGETTEPSLIREDDAIVKEKKMVSGLIFFKKQLVNINGKIKFILVGDIIKNDYAINKPSEEDIQELKKIIFGKN